MTGVQLPGVFGALAPVLDRYGYGAVAALVFLEDFGVPVPGETILIAAAVYAGTGRLDVVVLGIVAVAAAILGDNVGFAIGHFGGRPLVLRWGRLVLLTRPRLDRAERFFRAHGPWIVAIARFIEGLRQANGIVAGIARLPWARAFLPFNALGALLWAGVWITVGYVAGSRIDVLYAQFKRYEIYLGIAIAVALLAFIGRRLHRRRRHGPDDHGRDDDRAGRADHADRVPMTDRVDRFQRRHRWLGFPLAVLYKFIDDKGAYLAALITYYGFLSIFPLMLLAVTFLGYALHDNPGLQQQVLGSAVSQIPVLGQQLENNVRSLSGSVGGLIVGGLGSLYGGLGATVAGQNALNTIWRVPDNERPDPFVSRARGLLLLVIVGGGVLLTTGLSALTTAAGTLGAGAAFEVVIRAGSALLSIVLNAVLFTFAFRVLTAHRLPIRDHLLGAVLAAVAWQILQVLGTYYVGHELARASASYGLFGIVLGLIAWIGLGSMIVVFAAELNVVRTRKLYPRSLLTPLTDNVILTAADKSSYTSLAKSVRQKGFEHVAVDFDPPTDPGGPPPTAVGEGRAGHGTGSTPGTDDDRRTR